jgi:hypothetical protein
MKTSKAIRTYIAAALAVTVTVVTGCASTLKAPTGLRTERVSAGGVQLQSVHLEATESGLRISGTVGRMVGYGSSSRRHLDVEVVGADGVVLTRTTAMFSPNPIRRGLRSHPRSIYAITLPNVPPPDSLVRVTVHPTSLSECRK